MAETPASAFPPTTRRAQNAPAFCLTLRIQPAWFRLRFTNPVHCSVKNKTAPNRAFVIRAARMTIPLSRRSENPPHISAVAFAPRAAGHCGSGYAGPRFGRFAPRNVFTISEYNLSISPFSPRSACAHRPSTPERACFLVQDQENGRASSENQKPHYTAASSRQGYFAPASPDAILLDGSLPATYSLQKKCNKIDGV
jgi:hypothetical protein